MATNYPTLVTTRYVTAGAYIGQLIVPAPAITPDTRIPCYVGVGSRFAVAKNQSIRRSFVFDATLTFSPVAPFTAVLPHVAANDKSVSRIVKADNTEVKINQWQFLKNAQTGKYDSVQIASEVFDPVTTYKISYQSIDRNVLDSFPVADIREFVAVGNGPDSHDYTEYANFFAPATIGSLVAGVISDKMAPAATNDVLSLTSALTVVAGTSSGGTVAQDTTSAFAHDYNRFYSVRATGFSGTSPNRTATFEWTAQPVSGGNHNLPGVPLDPAAPKPTFTVTESTASMVQSLELGIKLVFTFTGGGITNFAIGDTFTFNGLGPAIIEVDARHANTNQYYEQGAIAKTAGTGFAGLSYAGTSNPSNTFNAMYQLACVAAADTSTKATVLVKHDGANGLTVTAKVGGVAGNLLTFGMVDPGTQNSPLTVTTSGNTVTVSLGTDNSGALVSTYTQVAAAIAAASSCPVTATTVGAGATTASPKIVATVDVSGANVTNAVATAPALSTKLHIGSKIRFSTQPNTVYTVASGLGLTAFTVSPAYSGTPVASSAVTGGANLSVTLNSTAVTGVGTQFVTDGLVVGSRIKFSNDLDRVYVVANVASATALTLSTPFLGATSSTVSATQPGVDIIEVSAPAASGVDGILSGTLAWAEYGDRTGVSGVTTYSYDQSLVPANPTVSLSNGVVLTLGLSSGPFVVGDLFTFKVKAPRQYYQSKDNRAVTLTTDAIGAAGAGTGSVVLSYTTNTPEGGFGIVTPAPEDNAFSPASSQWKNGHFTLAGNILGAVRNMHGGPTTTTVSGCNRHVAGNKFDFAATINGTIDWSLVSKTTDVISKGSILTDVLGFVTGSKATPYAILQNVPDSIVSVTEVDSGLPVSYSLVTTALGDNTQYVVFLGGKPTVDVQVSYIYRGAEPAPGQIYYVTSKHVRPDELFNQPILIRSLDDGRRLLGPSTADNHLYIMNEIAMGDVGCPAIYVVQVKDADGDSIYTDVDFADAIDASEAPRNISDLVVLSHFSSLSKQLNSVNKMADPFKRRFRMTWIGAPLGTSLGSEEEENTLIALSRRTLQVFGANPAHGTRVLVGATSCTRDVKLDNNVVTSVTLDGSFVAGALAALTASFADPSDTVLRKTLPGFTTIQTYGDIESPTNLALGAANIIFFTDQGGGVYRIEEDVTVDTFAPDFNLINNMTQKMFVVKQVRQELDSKLIGLIVPSAEAGVGLVRGFLVQMLATLLGRGFIGRYQKADGSERPIDPSKDVIVFRDTTDPTLYHILFAFWLKNEIKRIFGLYTVNSNDFGG